MTGVSKKSVFLPLEKIKWEGNTLRQHGAGRSRMRCDGSFRILAQLEGRSWGMSCAWCLFDAYKILAANFCLWGSVTNSCLYHIISPVSAQTAFSLAKYDYLANCARCLDDAQEMRTTKTGCEPARRHLHWRGPTCFFATFLSMCLLTSGHGARRFFGFFPAKMMLIWCVWVCVCFQMASIF